MIDSPQASGGFLSILPFAAFVAPFLFPLPLSIVLAIPLAFSLPLGALAFGAFIDVLYYIPGAGMLPYGTIIGALAAAAAYAVRHFVRTRIISS